MKKTLSLISILALLAITFVSCEKDKDVVTKPEFEQNLEKVKKILNGDLIVSGRTGIFNYVNPFDSTESLTVDMTKLPTGCPMKYNFKWNDDSTLFISIPKFHFSTMPFAIDFNINAKLTQLNDQEKKTHPGKGWIKFSGENGSSRGIYVESGNIENFGDSATIQGFVNVVSMQIELDTRYEVDKGTSTYLPIETICPLQKIDLDLINHYDELAKKYEEDVIKWEDEHPNTYAPQYNLQTKHVMFKNWTKTRMIR